MWTGQGCICTALDIPVRFWVCPDHRRDGRVEWEGDAAYCLTCGRTSKDELSQGVTE